MAPDRPDDTSATGLARHTAARPLWLCRMCAAPWPCQPARLDLLAEYEGSRVALDIYLCLNLHEAVRDLYRLNPHQMPDARTLFDRFLGWVPRPMKIS